MTSAYTQVLYASCGVLVLSGIGLVWRRELSALVRLLAVQGAALALIAAVQAAHTADVELAAVAVIVAALKAVVLPRVLRRVLARDDEPREVRTAERDGERGEEGAEGPHHEPRERDVQEVRDRPIITEVGDDFCVRIFRTFDGMSDHDEPRLMGVAGPPSRGNTSQGVATPFELC